jgi:oligoribonuclease
MPAILGTVALLRIPSRLPGGTRLCPPASARARLTVCPSPPRTVVNPHPSHLVWIDLEMTGLVPEQHRIIEIATIVTDQNLNVLAEGPVIAIHRSEEELAAMDEWNTRQHGGSGLIQRVRDSRIDDAAAERQTLDFLRQWSVAGRSPMCGNSICQDRRFLARWMPELERHFHYRNLDVSTLKELCNRWAPAVAQGFTKASSHLALDDIRDSIAELVYYRSHFLRLPETT